MKLTNRNNYPDALYQAVKNDSYDKGECDFSVTELLKPSRQWALQKIHQDELIEDIEDRLWSLYGQIAHLILERANKRDFAEERLFVEVDGSVISGQIDTLSLDDGTLSDWKFTTSYSFIKGKPAKEEWTWQLNMQRYLLWFNGYKDVESLKIVGLLRDWQKSKAKLDSSYPQNPIAYHDIKVLGLDYVEKYIIHRKDSHLRALKELPKCTAKETWNGRRCESWCSVKLYCQQYQSAIKTGILEEI